MSKQLVDVGINPDDGQGDPLRAAFIKINENFDEMYSYTSNFPISNIAATGSLTNSTFLRGDGTWSPIGDVGGSVTIGTYSDGTVHDLIYQVKTIAFEASTNGLTITSMPNNTVRIGLNLGDVFPSQTGHAGMYLTTDGSIASWANLATNITQPDLNRVLLTIEGLESPSPNVWVDCFGDNGQHDSEVWVAVSTIDADGNTYALYDSYVAAWAYQSVCIVRKTSPTGEQLWVKYLSSYKFIGGNSWTDVYAGGLALGPDGNVHVTVNFADYGSNVNDDGVYPVAMKLSSVDGSEIWRTPFTGVDVQDYEYFQDIDQIEVNALGETFIVGNADNWWINWIAKISPTGEIQNIKTLGLYDSDNHLYWDAFGGDQQEIFSLKDHNGQFLLAACNGGYVHAISYNLTLLWTVDLFSRVNPSTNMAYYDDWTAGGSYRLTEPQLTGLASDPDGNWYVCTYDTDDMWHCGAAVGDPNNDGIRYSRRGNFIVVAKMSGATISSPGTLSWAKQVFNGTQTMTDSWWGEVIIQGAGYSNGKYIIGGIQYGTPLLPGDTNYISGISRNWGDGFVIISFDSDTGDLDNYRIINAYGYWINWPASDNRTISPNYWYWTGANDNFAVKGDYCVASFTAGVNGGTRTSSMTTMPSEVSVLAKLPIDGSLIADYAGTTFNSGAGDRFVKKVIVRNIPEINTLTENMTILVLDNVVDDTTSLATSYPEYAQAWNMVNPALVTTPVYPMNFEYQWEPNLWTGWGELIEGGWDTGNATVIPYEVTNLRPVCVSSDGEFSMEFPFASPTQVYAETDYVRTLGIWDSYYDYNTGNWVDILPSDPSNPGWVDIYPWLEDDWIIQIDGTVAADGFTIDGHYSGKQYKVVNSCMNDPGMHPDVPGYFIGTPPVGSNYAYSCTFMLVNLDDTPITTNYVESPYRGNTTGLSFKAVTNYMTNWSSHNNQSNPNDPSWAWNKGLFYTYDKLQFGSSIFNTTVDTDMFGAMYGLGKEDVIYEFDDQGNITFGGTPIINPIPIVNTALGLPNTNMAGKFLKTDGYTTSWDTVPIPGDPGNYNCNLGYHALYNPYSSAGVGDRNTAIGWGSMDQTTSKWYGAVAYNTAVGIDSMGGYWTSGGDVVDNVAIGNSALYSGAAASRNVAVGAHALLSTTYGFNNVAVGYDAGKNLYNYYNGVNQNTLIGCYAGTSAVSGNNNTFIGYNSGWTVTSGSNNTFIGSGAGGSVTTGSNNIIIGGYGGSGTPNCATGNGNIVFSTYDGTVRGYFDSSGVLMLNNGIGGTGVVSSSTAQTLTNKLIAPRIDTSYYTSTTYYVGATYDMRTLWNMSANFSFARDTNTTFVDGQKFILRLKDDGSPRTLTWNSSFRAVGCTLPSTTIVNKVMYVGMVWNNWVSLFDVILVASE